MSQPMSSQGNEKLVNDGGNKPAEQGAFSYATSAQQGTIEARENMRDLISNARPRDPEAVLNEQRILAEGLGVAGAVIEERRETHPNPGSGDFGPDNTDQIDPSAKKEG